MTRDTEAFPDDGLSLKDFAQARVQSGLGSSCSGGKGSRLGGRSTGAPTRRRRP